MSTVGGVRMQRRCGAGGNREDLQQEWRHEQGWVRLRGGGRHMMQEKWQEHRCGEGHGQGQCRSQSGLSKELM